MALLGNVYLGVMLLFLAVLLLVAALSVVWLKAAGVKIAIVMAVFLWMVLKALWVKLSPPQGAEITARDAPALFAMIEELRRALRSPRFHHVLVTDDFNAAVAQAPRLGLFGWSRNYLLIGLPLAKALTAEQFKAVLAHEFGHLSKGHGRMSNWIYCQRLRWSRLMAVLEAAESWGLFLFRPFLRWYAPYFNAYSYPLARANEFEADATSARLASRRAAAEALTAVNVVGAISRSASGPRSCAAPTRCRSPRLRRSRSWARASRPTSTRPRSRPGSSRRWRARPRSTTRIPRSPSACTRWARSPALCFRPPARRPTACSAARSSASRANSTSAGTRASCPPGRSAIAKSRRRASGSPSSTPSTARGAELTLQEAYDRRSLPNRPAVTWRAASRNCARCTTRAADDPVLHYTLGLRLLARDDETGAALLKRAMQRDPWEIVRCCQALRDYCWRKGRKDEAHEWHRRMSERMELEHAAKKERDEVRSSDRFERHGMEATGARADAGAAQGDHRPAQGLLREKARQVYAGACVRHPGLHRAARLAALEGQGQRAGRAPADPGGRRRFPGETLILSVEGGNAAFGRKFRWMRGSRIV